MKIEFYDTKGSLLTDIDLPESDVKILVRYAILDIIKKTADKKTKLMNSFREEIDKVDKIYYNKQKTQKLLKTKKH